MDGATVIALQLADGRTATYPSLDGDGLAVDPHQERPDITWRELTEQYPLPQVLRLQEASALAAEAHLAGCTLAQHIPS